MAVERSGCDFCFKTLDPQDVDEGLRSFVKCNNCGQLYHVRCWNRCKKCLHCEHDQVQSIQIESPLPLHMVKKTQAIPITPLERATPSRNSGVIGVAVVVVGLISILLLGLVSSGPGNSVPTATKSLIDPNLEDNTQVKTLPTSVPEIPQDVRPTASNLSTAIVPSPTTSRVHSFSGTRVVFSRGDVGCSDLIAYDADDTFESRFAWGNNYEEPSWSRDGTKIVASSGSCFDQNQSLIVLTLNDNSSTRIVSGGNNIDPSWGRDDRIYFARGSKTDNGDLYSVKSDGTDLQSLGEQGRQPSLSPDGKHLTFMRLNRGVWRVWVATRGRSGRLSGLRQIVFPSVAGGVHARMPNWTSDSKLIIFSVTDKNFDTVALGTVVLSTGISHVWKGTSPYGSPFARPSCGENNLCVANEVTGGMWLLKVDDGEYSIQRQITTNAKDWGADIYP